ncbi:MAG: tetraacyldisaccharide 4'-kinase [Nitrospinae bacterium]|nr:tetraacyldisaccharide 4'-kinase [Nitrospinota bacterium]MDA1109397.1 tetraacyldisaccharide 4'-kinase [Nitrospinota bacterium]
MRWESLYYKIISPERKFYHVPAYLLLKGASLFYCLGLRLNRWAYRFGISPTRRLPVRVISVGNLTLGGTGKTPIVIMIAEILRGHGYKPAILSRGYGGSSKEAVNVVCDGQNILLSADVAGDEPRMIAERLKNIPVLTGKNRYLTGSVAIDRFGVDTLILDDGFQHRALCRDLNILLFDQKKPLGNGNLFPAGELRESAKESDRADLICFTRCSPSGNATFLKAQLPLNTPVIKTALRPGAVVRLDNHDTLDVEILKDQAVAAFCGIAKPGDFRATLETAGARVVFYRAFGDHHRYVADELQSLDREALDAGAKYVLVSEKDSVKIDASLFSIPVLKLIVDVEILEGREAFTKLLLKS